MRSQVKNPSDTEGATKGRETFQKLMSYQRNKRNHKTEKDFVHQKRKESIRMNVTKSRISSRIKYERSYAKISKKNSIKEERYKQVLRSKKIAAKA